MARRGWAQAWARSWKKWGDPKCPPPLVIYNDLAAFEIKDKPVLTTETRRQADLLFASLVEKATKFKRSKLFFKKTYFQGVLHAIKEAVYHEGCIMVDRNNANKNATIKLQVIDSAVETGLLKEYRSPPGSPKRSRYWPLDPARQVVEKDPWEFDPSNQTQFVFVRDRATGDEIDFDHALPIPTQYQQGLALVNRINSQCEITYRKFNAWEESYSSPKRLRPIHFAIFTDDFDHHGRIYTSKYGHQALRKIERQTIRFDGEECVELDYSGLHPRLLYHCEEIDYQGDPYALWGNSTTPAMRVLAKEFVNAMINAKSAKSAVSACNNACRTFTEEKDEAGRPKKKTGKALDDARKLLNARRQTGLTFLEMVPLAYKYHEPIAKYFGQDVGMQLMRVDSGIALDVLTHFADLALPCLGCHDGFVVPIHLKVELRAAMMRLYEQWTGYLPTVR